MAGNSSGGIAKSEDWGVYTWLVTLWVGLPSLRTGQGAHIFGPWDHMDFLMP